jgi:hypothetical protein
VDCFENWTIGEATGRYFEGKILCDFTAGAYFVDGLEIVCDKEDLVQSAAGVSIGVSGTSITFDSQYHSTPRIQVTTQSSASRIATIDNVTTTGFDINVFDSGGTQVTGTVDWEARGA